MSPSEVGWLAYLMRVHNRGSHSRIISEVSTCLSYMRRFDHCSTREVEASQGMGP